MIEELGGFFKEGDELSSIIGMGSASVFERAGRNGVSRIVVGQVDGPMGFYAVAVVFDGENVKSVHPLHMLESICLKKEPRNEDDA